MLRLSSFITVSFEYRLFSEWGEYDYGFEFLKTLIDMDTEKTFISKIFNGKGDIPPKKKTALLKGKAGEAKCRRFISEWLMNQIRVMGLNDFCDCVANLISSDQTISERQKTEMLNPFLKGEYGTFLRMALMYAISKDNVLSKTKIDEEDLQYVIDTHFKCPLCGKGLKLGSEEKPLFRYSITSIFPESIKGDKASMFETVRKRPADPEHRSNRICLCPECANQYEASPTTDTYGKLILEKERMIATNKSNSTLDNAGLDDEIAEVLFKLKDIDSFEGLAELRKTAVPIKRKIRGNKLLEEDITKDVLSYYNYIRKQLSDLDGNDGEFRVIASQFHTCFTKLDNEISDQEEIYNRIVKWVLDSLRMTEKYRAAARIIVSFFVQNCEVFYEITE